MDASFNRRDFLKIAGLAGAAGSVGCSRDQKGTLVSLVIPSDQTIPGVDTWFATTCRECPSGCGMTVRTREGRVTKVEGNSEHPVSRGGLCIRGQASLQGLYNPDRFRGPLRRSKNGALDPITWDDALKLLAEKLRPLANGSPKDRVAFISGARGPAMDKLVHEWLAAFNSTGSLVYEPFSLEPLREANRLLFGKSVISTPRIADADYLISFGADYLETWLQPVAFTRAFAEMRGSHDPLNFSNGEESREAQRRPGKIVHIEPRLSLTAANADEWHSAAGGSEVYLIGAMINTILSKGPAKPRDGARLQSAFAAYDTAEASARTGMSAEVIEKLAVEFASAESSVAIGGGAALSGPDATDLMTAIQMLNYVAGRIGSTVRLDQPIEGAPVAGKAEWASLLDAMNAGAVDVLFVHSVNPLHALPAELGLPEALRKVPLVVSLSSYPDETSELAHLILPDHTPLEQWGDYRRMTGVHSLVQPTMNPLFDTRQTADVLLSVARLAGANTAAAAVPQDSFQSYVKETWRTEYGKSAGEDFDTFWNESLARGGRWQDGISSEADTAVNAPLASGALDLAFAQAAPARAADEFHLHVYPSSRYYDGRGANRPWLHEIPDPITKVTWDSWVELHPETAKSLGVVEGDIVVVQSPHGLVEAPAYIYEGIRKDTVAIPLGLGHTSFGRYAHDVGINPVRLLGATADARTGAFAYAGTKVKLTKAARNTPLARTDGSLTDYGRGFSQTIPISALLEGNTQAQEEAGHEAGRHLASVHYSDNYPPHEHKDYRWGMAINLSSCTGCSACVAACYAENNIPVVGKEQVARGRNMAWIRIERYMENISATPDVRFSPMLCQHCDNAPCEPVCPVYATQHNSEGLNVQTYNRCVGTRYCSNNCPYKVRAFNWFDPHFEEPLHLQLNPDVSARSKGIMEKCSFCVQRIRGAKDHAKDEGRKVMDGEATPACAQSCPAQAISFGNLLDPESAVSKLSSLAHGYKVLDELNTKPAITYLPRVKQA
jgi:anaerobic selenocysteine-containing dehydrogenase/Fe-S-cluster-containing dehydrogenase component